MPTSTSKSTSKKSAEGLQGVIEGLQENEQSALDAVQRFIETVNDAFPDIGEDGPRKQIIDAAFKMTGQIVEASNRMAINVLDVTEGALRSISERSEKETSKASS